MYSNISVAQAPTKDIGDRDEDIIEAIIESYSQDQEDGIL
jgi:hypothetical protein